MGVGRFGHIVHINGEDELHLEWFDHMPNAFLDDIADPRELFLTLLCEYERRKSARIVTRVVKDGKPTLPGIKPDQV